jgi:hypothetical protein
LDTLGHTRAPSADFIEIIGYASLNPLFRKPKFRKSLIEYRKTGLYPKYVQKSNPKLELYYKKILESQRTLERIEQIKRQVKKYEVK